MPKIIHNFKGDKTFAFHADGRDPHQIDEMKDYGYVEIDHFANPKKIRTDGYFCGSCKAFDHKPHSIKGLVTFHDGWCKKYNFADRDYGCCGGWEPK